MVIAKLFSPPPPSLPWILQIVYINVELIADFSQVAESGTLTMVI